MHEESRLRRMPAGQPSQSHLISQYGIAGETACHGLIRVGRPKEGETVLVSAAAGSVGVSVGQVAKNIGCRAIGIAGGPEKCIWVTDTPGFDACIGCTNESVHGKIVEHAREGVGTCFENVVGEILEAALFKIVMNGRVVCCGTISQHDADDMNSPRSVPGVIVFKRLRVKGFVVTDFPDKDADALQSESQVLDIIMFL